MSRYKGDPNGCDRVLAAQVTGTHALMHRALYKKLGCSGAEAIRTALEDAYAAYCPDGDLVPPARRFIASDGRVYVNRGVTRG